MKTRFTLIIVFLFTLTNTIFANTYFVATNGDDANAGTEIQAWKTIQKAATTLVAGDTVFVKAGTYNERVIVQNSGTLTDNIVFSNYQNETVTIDGTAISWGNSWNGLFDLTDKSYIQLIGFKIINADYAGIWLENSNHIIIQDNYTYDTFSSGIGVWNSSHIIIKNNEVELACNDGEQECITIANSSNCDIVNNNVHDNGLGTEGGEGIDIKAGSHDVNVYQNEVHHLNNRLGIYADAWDLHTYNINIYQNTIHHCTETGLAVASENGGLIENVNIYNNLIYYNQYGGIELGSWSDIGFPGVKPIEHIKIINNTCSMNGEYNDGWGYGIVIDNPNAKDILIRNNICSDNSAQMAIQQIESGAIVDHNLLYGNNTASGTLFGSDSIVENPLFVDATNYNFHLLENSAAIDNGSSENAPDFDFDNHNRPTGMGIDIGAFEYNSNSNILDNSKLDNLVEISPNPTFDRFKIKISDDKYQKYTFRFFTIKGKLVREESSNRANNGTFIFDRKDLVSGLYILKIIINNKIVISKKLVIK